MDNRTHSQRRRAEMQEALRERIAGQKHLTYIEADLSRDIDPDEVPVVKLKMDVRLRLLAKILPDLSESKTDLAVSGNLRELFDHLPTVDAPDAPAPGSVEG